MEKSFYNIVSQCQKAKRWRYELPNFLPISPSNLTIFEKDLFVANSLVGESFNNNTRKVRKRNKYKWTLPISYKTQKLISNQFLWCGFLKKGFDLVDGYGIAVSCKDIYTLFSLKVIDGDLINPSSFFVVFRWNKVVFIATVKGIVRDGILYVGHGIQVTTTVAISEKTASRKKIQWFKSLMYRFRRVNKARWTKVLFTGFRKQPMKKKKLPMRNIMLKICARLKWRNELHRKRHSLFHVWKRGLVFNYILLKQYYSMFYRRPVEPEISIHWWKLDYKNSIQGKFIRKKTKSGRIYKRLHSVLRIEI